MPGRQRVKDTLYEDRNSIKYGSRESAGLELCRAVPLAPWEDGAGWGLSCQALMTESNLEDK